MNDERHGQPCLRPLPKYVNRDLTHATLSPMVRPVGPYASYVVQTVITLVAVCALAFVVLYGARRLGVGRPRGPIELVGLLPLEARRSIYLVRVGEQILIVGASEAGFTKLGEASTSALSLDTGGSSAGGAPFVDVLARALRRPNASSAASRDEPR